MRGRADNPLRPEKLSGLKDAHVRLTDMYAVRAALQTDTDIVIDNQGHAVSSAYGQHLHRLFRKAFAVHLFLAQLHKRCAAFERFLHGLRKRLPSQPSSVRDGIDAEHLFIEFHNINPFRFSAEPARPSAGSVFPWRPLRRAAKASRPNESSASYSIRLTASMKKVLNDAVPAF